MTLHNVLDKSLVFIALPNVLRPEAQRFVREEMEGEMVRNEFVWAAAFQSTLSTMSNFQGIFLNAYFAQGTSQSIVPL